MILPAGVTKGSGLREALGDLGLSPHNAIGVGDAENDHSLLDACEVGVAVANAVDAIRAHADMTLALPDGEGVADLLLGPLLAGRAHLHPRRWQVTLGTDDGGEPVTLPGSQLNIAVCGGTGGGKSYLAGLICEQLIRLGYSLVVFDPEGDHHGLGELRDVIITGGDEGRLADPGEVVRLLRHGHASVVTDLSRLDAAARAAYAADLASAVEAHRAATGMSAVGGRRRSPRAHRAGRDRAPHVRPGRQGLPAGHLAARGTVGRRPASLSTPSSRSAPRAPTAGSSTSPRRWPTCPAPRSPASSPGRPAARCWPGDSIPAGRWRSLSGPGSHPICVTSTSTISPASSPPAGSTSGPGPTPPPGRSPANLAELEAELGRCDRGVLRHHCPRHEFSGWVAGVFRDERSPPTSPPPRPPCRPTATPRSSSRYAWRSSPRSRAAAQAEPAVPGVAGVVAGRPRDSPENQGTRAPYVGGQLTRLRRQALPGNGARRAPIGVALAPGRVRWWVFRTAGAGARGWAGGPPPCRYGERARITRWHCCLPFVAGSGHNSVVHEITRRRLGLAVCHSERGDPPDPPEATPAAPCSASPMVGPPGPSRWGSQYLPGGRPPGPPGGDPGRPEMDHSVLLNSAMAMPTMPTPMTATMPRERPTGTVQPSQETPGAIWFRAAGLRLRWLKTARRMGATM